MPSNMLCIIAVSEQLELKLKQNVHVHAVGEGGIKN